MRETGDVTNLGIEGDKKYQLTARKALPILVRQAKAATPITYGKLADELGMPNHRNLNYPHGAIGNSMLDLTEVWGFEVPPIQALVVNKDTGLPGDGISWFAPDAKAFAGANIHRRREIVELMLSKVFGFEKWDHVLAHFGLEPADTPLALIESAAIAGRHASGESIEHQKLKQFVAGNPHLLGLPPTCEAATEHPFPTGDAVDVLFRSGREWVGVEVKSCRSDQLDIARGLFQTVKYEALIRAQLKAAQVIAKARVVLVLESWFPPELVGLKNTLGVAVIDQAYNRWP